LDLLLHFPLLGSWLLLLPPQLRLVLLGFDLGLVLRHINLHKVKFWLILSWISWRWWKTSGLVILGSGHFVSVNSTPFFRLNILEVTGDRLALVNLELSFLVLIFIQQLVPVLLRRSSLLSNFGLSVRIQV
jgi:hypothetical protein